MANKTTAADLREFLKEVFAAHWTREELSNFDDLQSKFAFHLSDAADDIHRLSKLFRDFASTDVEAATRIVHQALLHTVPHLMSAAQILDYIPKVFEEQNGVHGEDHVPS